MKQKKLSENNVQKLSENKQKKRKFHPQLAVHEKIFTERHHNYTLSVTILNSGVNRYFLFPILTKSSSIE